MTRHKGTNQKAANNFREDGEPVARIRSIPIAVVGMASLMPDAKSLDKYWDNIYDKVNSIVDVPANRWSLDDYYDPNPRAEDKTYCKRGGFIPEIGFNPMDYGLPPNILEVTDTNQLLSLVVAKDVLEDAGIFTEKDYDHDRIGCVLGIGGGQKLSAALTARLQYPVLEKILSNAGVAKGDVDAIIEKYKAHFAPWEENSFPGLLGNVVAGRIANRFNLGGINSVIDAACASALSAVKVAIHELTDGHSDMMITGGSCTDNSIFMYMSFSKTPAFTTNENSQPFDIDSKGMLVGEGIAMMALKRLTDAQRDGDRIYAVIKGIGSSSDGKSKSIYAPRSGGQAKALRRAYADAGYEPQTIGLLEAHGTGTAAGDVAEFDGLKEVFGADNDQKQYIALGSVKSQIGHLKAAAGIAGMMKSVLALHHKVLPPTINISQPLPKLGIEDSPFYLNTETRPWLPNKHASPRRAGVSAFGFGGTNFHVALEEYQPLAQGAYRLRNTAQMILIDAPTQTDLVKQCKERLTELESVDHLNYWNEFIEATALREIPAQHARIGFLATCAQECIATLKGAITQLEKNTNAEHWETPNGMFYRQSGLDLRGKAVALFSGQGSQYLNMGVDLANNFPPFLSSLVEMDQEFLRSGQNRLTQTLYPIPVFDKEAQAANEAEVQKTQFAQPGIGVFSAGSFKIAQAAGFSPDFIAGHSFGELTALWAAGVYSEKDFYTLAKARGQAMAAPEDPNFDAGTMMAVIGKVAAVEQALENFADVRVANYNSLEQVVIAGPGEATGQAAEHLKSQGFRVVALPVSAAFHTPLVGHAQQPFAEVVEGIRFKKPKVAVYSNATGKKHSTSAKTIKTALQKHILSAVRFREEIETIHNDGGYLFVEFGPKNVLTKLVKQILADKPHLAIAVNAKSRQDSDAQLRSALLQMSVAGIALHNADPYQCKQRITNTMKPSPLKINLVASNHKSEKTLEALEEKMTDGFKIAPAAEKQISLTPTATRESPDANKETTLVTVDGNQLSEDIQKSMAMFYQNESETLGVHQQYLQAPKAYSHTFLNIMEQQMTLQARNPESPVPTALVDSLNQFHAHQNDTLRVHEEYLQQQSENSKAALDLMTTQYSLLTDKSANTHLSSTVGKAPAVESPLNAPGSEPASALVEKEAAGVTAIIQEEPDMPANSAPSAEQSSATSQIDPNQLMKSMLRVVADKTGYPQDMLELDMDMEGDLGIDSIKRVEILGTVQDEYPDLPEMLPEEMAELRTLKQIVDYMNAQIATSTPVLRATIVPSPAANTSIGQGTASVSTNTTPSAPKTGSAPGINIDQLMKSMLAVVADKTGYPKDMLELDMDMEADLGIDSIKRVEILGTIQDEYPDLPEMLPEEMAELRTLKQIVDYMNAQMLRSAPALAVTASPVASAESEFSGIDANQLMQAMLAVVADKTGYPEDMLELDMDMEADLGIDSIKRVEILGAVQDMFPQLPEPDTDALVGLKTLAQVVDFLSRQGESRTSAESSTPINASGETNVKKSLTPRVNTAYGQLAEIPLADELVQPVPAERSCLIVSDGTTLTTMLAEKLLKRGWPVNILIPPRSIVAQVAAYPDGTKTCLLENCGDEEIKQAIETLESESGKTAACICLDPTYEVGQKQGLDYSTEKKAFIQLAFFTAKHLKHSLEQAEPFCRPAFLSVSHLNGKLGHDRGDFSVVAGGLFGLSKTLKQEWPNVHCRAIDCHPRIAADRAANHIIAELYDANAHLSETGYDLSCRYSVNTAQILSTPKSSNRIAKEDVFLVSGGAKGVTAHCIMALAREYQCKFILMGRSPCGIAEPDWALECDNENELKKLAMQELKSRGEKPTPVKINALLTPILSGREILAVMNAIKQAGGEVEYICGSVTDTKTIKKQVRQAEERLGTITGIVHGAGVLADKVIEKKTQRDFNAVYDTKVAGISTLFECVDVSSLKVLAMFSSAAAFFGNPAQSDYAIANEILNKTALRLKTINPDCQVLSFNWGPWDGGMVSPELKRLFAQRNIDVIPLDEGAQIFIDHLRAADNTRPQVIVGSSMTFAESTQTDAQLRSYQLQRAIEVDNNAFLQDHRIGENPVLPVVCAAAWMAQAGENLYPGFQCHRMEDLRLFKGIVFDKNLPARFDLFIEEKQKSSETILLDTRIEGKTPQGKVLKYYQVQIELSQKDAVMPKYLDYDLNKTSEQSGVELYAKGTLFHGPRFQVIDQVLNISKDRLTLKCHPTQISPAEEGQFRLHNFNPFIHDVVFQAILVWVRKYYDAGSLPMATQWAEHYAAVPANAPFYVSLETESQSATAVRAHIIVHDEKGNVYSRFGGVEATISQQLNKLFMQASTQETSQQPISIVQNQ